MFDSITLARLTFVRDAMRSGLAFQGDTASAEIIPIPVIDPKCLKWSERALIYGVEGLESRWHSGQYSQQGYPIPTEEYIARVREVYGHE